MVFHIEYDANDSAEFEVSHYMTEYLDDFQRVLTNITRSGGLVTKIWTDEQLSWKLER